MFLPSPKEFTFFTPWWRCGLYFELTVSTGTEPAVIGELELFDTSYPLTIEAGATTSDMRLNRILPMCLRTLEMCMHETFVDCPFYEQLMYIGDSRLEALLVMAVSHDYRMVEKMLRMFAASAGHDGLPASRYPSRIRQVIPTFAPFWIGALHDFAMYGGDPKLVAELLGPAKRIIDAFQSRLNRDGLIEFT